MEDLIWIESFQAGPQTSSNKETREYTIDDLEEIRDSYNPELHEAALTVGHPMTDSAPAYGWIKDCKVENDKLLVLVEPTKNARELVQEGHYKKVSCGFYHPEDPHNPTPGQWYLQHVALLGAAPPAVKGLRQFVFSESALSVEFSPESKSEEPDLTIAQPLVETLTDSEPPTEGLPEAISETLPDETPSELPDNPEFTENLSMETDMPRKPKSPSPKFSEPEEPTPVTEPGEILMAEPEIPADIPEYLEPKEETPEPAMMAEPEPPMEESLAQAYQEDAMEMEMESTVSPEPDLASEIFSEIDHANHKLAEKFSTCSSFNSAPKYTVVVPLFSEIPDEFDPETLVDYDMDVEETFSAPLHFANGSFAMMKDGKVGGANIVGYSHKGPYSVIYTDVMPTFIQPPQPTLMAEPEESEETPEVSMDAQMELEELTRLELERQEQEDLGNLVIEDEPMEPMDESMELESSEPAEPPMDENGEPMEEIPGEMVTEDGEVIESEITASDSEEIEDVTSVDTPVEQKADVDEWNPALKYSEYNKKNANLRKTDPAMVKLQEENDRIKRQLVAKDVADLYQRGIVTQGAIPSDKLTQIAYKFSQISSDTVNFSDDLGINNVYEAFMEVLQSLTPSVTYSEVVQSKPKAKPIVDMPKVPKGSTFSESSTDLYEEAIAVSQKRGIPFNQALQFLLKQ